MPNGSTSWMQTFTVRFHAVMVCFLVKVVRKARSKQISRALNKEAETHKCSAKRPKVW